MVLSVINSDIITHMLHETSFTHNTGLLLRQMLEYIAYMEHVRLTIVKRFLKQQTRLEQLGGNYS